MVDTCSAKILIFEIFAPGAMHEIIYEQQVVATLY